MDGDPRHNVKDNKLGHLERRNKGLSEVQDEPGPFTRVMMQVLGNVLEGNARRVPLLQVR